VIADATVEGTVDETLCVYEPVTVRLALNGCGVDVGVRVGVAVRVGVGVRVAVWVGVGVRVATELGVAVGVGVQVPATPLH
jgi:hypothetical protein